MKNFQFWVSKFTHNKTEKEIRLDNMYLGKSGIHNMHHNLEARIKNAKELLLDSSY